MCKLLTVFNVALRDLERNSTKLAVNHWISMITFLTTQTKVEYSLICRNLKYILTFIQEPTKFNQFLTFYLYLLFTSVCFYNLYQYVGIVVFVVSINLLIINVK